MQPHIVGLQQTKSSVNINRQVEFRRAVTVGTIMGKVPPRCIRRCSRKRWIELTLYPIRKIRGVPASKVRSNSVVLVFRLPVVKVELVRRVGELNEIRGHETVSLAC